MNTKQKILNASKKLFNSTGVPEITTRHIAASIDISQGNLHYHYPNKDVLLLTLYDEYISKMTELERYSNQSMSLEDMIGSMRDNFELMYNYRFLFIDRDYIWRRVPLIETNYKKLIFKKRQEFEELINHFISDGIFKSDISQLQIIALVDHLELIITTWVYLIPFKENLSQKNYADYFSQLTFRLWIPYLSKDFKDEWEAVLIK